MMKKNQIIFDIIKQCNENPRAFMTSKEKTNNNIIPMYKSWAPTVDFFHVTEDEMSETKEINESQCSSFWPDGFTGDKSLLTIFAIGHKHRLPYLQYLNDLRMREKIE
eukprot:120613_1